MLCCKQTEGLSLPTLDGLEIMRCLVSVPVPVCMNTQGIQCLLQLPRANPLQLLNTAPSLLLAGPAAIEVHMQRVAGGLGLSTAAAAAAGPDALNRLLQALTRLGTDALLDHNAAVQKVRCYCQHAARNMSTGHT